MHEPSVVLRGLAGRVCINCRLCKCQRLGSQLISSITLCPAQVGHLIELQWISYKNMAARILDTNAMVAKMSGVRWDLKEITSEHNAYVDSLVQDVNIVHGRLQSLGQKRIPPQANKTLWTELFLIVNRVFVEGCVQQAAEENKRVLSRQLRRTGNVGEGGEYTGRGENRRRWRGAVYVQAERRPRDAVEVLKRTKDTERARERRHCRSYTEEKQGTLLTEAAQTLPGRCSQHPCRKL